jgi:hypothetical protein
MLEVTPLVDCGHHHHKETQFHHDDILEPIGETMEVENINENGSINNLEKPIDACVTLRGGKEIDTLKFIMSTESHIKEKRDDDNSTKKSMKRKILKIKINTLIEMNLKKGIMTNQ